MHAPQDIITYDITTNWKHRGGGNWINNGSFAQRACLAAATIYTASTTEHTPRVAGEDQYRAFASAQIRE
jgi:hypothetical protein